MAVGPKSNRSTKTHNLIVTTSRLLAVLVVTALFERSRATGAPLTF
jgi:hypothetical protein